MSPTDGQTIEGVSAHAIFRYRDRVNPRAHDAAREILADLARTVPRRTPPRWVTAPDPGDCYYALGADDHGPARCYLIRDGLVITVLTSQDVTWHGKPRRRRRHSKPRRALAYA